MKHIVPLASESIIKQDGTRKSDCKQTAAKYLLQGMRREHPDMDMTVIEYSLDSNVPQVKFLSELGIHFILGVTPGGPVALM